MLSRHHFETQEDGTIRCTVCTWIWNRQPTSAGECPGVPRFRYGHVPASLQTYTQLRRKGLKPRDREKPDGCYYAVRRKYWLFFYEESEALPRRQETEAQKAARERAWIAIQEKYRCPECGRAPLHLVQIKHFQANNLCTSCWETARAEAEQGALEAQIEQDEHDATAWAASLLQRSDWCLLDTDSG